ncbi:hypothetical protein [Desulfosporosinus youngiae]|uniref:Uncharacterized protein n=1 Tax=Desulfosporosinus youngiae DSM 17734 TaxID=768710 RepID=H5XSR2_9FIRM|nr:hypothetical protein [Desulfosporosinus youngiae]EHQ87730.1 hypothetical protein DesyoDRAFT_0548 [Desulfosporosinus youngiae DSM 17734]
MRELFKLSLLETIVFVGLSIFTYLLVFVNIVQLNQFFLSKTVISTLCLLCTVIGIAFVYEAAISHVLSIFGLNSDNKGDVN